MRLFGTMGAEASFREEDFFGREEELSALSRAAVEGARGIGSSFMIYGPPNVGKTSLLLGLRGLLRSEGTLLLEGVDPRSAPRARRTPADRGG